MGSRSDNRGDDVRRRELRRRQEGVAQVLQAFEASRLQRLSQRQLQCIDTFLRLLLRLAIRSGCSLNAIIFGQVHARHLLHCRRSFMSDREHRSSLRQRRETERRERRETLRALRLASIHRFRLKRHLNTMVGNASSSLDQKQAWLRAREELRQAQIVTVKQGLSLTPSLYFGTRRCTYSSVVSVVTTAVPLPRFDPLDAPVKLQSPTNAVKPTDNSRWAEERAREALNRFKHADDNQSEPEARSPYTLAKAFPTQQQQTLALVREQRAFMQSLHATRRARARREHEAALVIQRVRRGFVLRRQFRSIRQKMLVRKRIRGSLLQVTKGTAIVLGEKDRRLRLHVKQNGAACKIQGAYRVWTARRLLAKLRALRRHELRQRCASVIQGTWRACMARWLATKLRLQREQARLQALARLLSRLFLGFRARCRVRALRLRRETQAAFKLQTFVRCRLLAAKALRQARARTAQERGHSGAAMMQSLVRGMLQRALVVKLRRAEELAVRVACTLSIQRVIRGFLGRQRARRRGLERAHERGWICAMHVTRIARGFLGRLEASRERAVQEADLLVQARRGNVEAVVDLLDGFAPSAAGIDDAMDDELPVIEPADVAVVSVPGGNTVLHLAAKFGHLEVVTLVLPRLLSTAPELVYATNAKGLTALALAVTHGHERVAMYLLAMTTPLFVDRVLPGRRRTLLHEAARVGLETVVAKLLQLFPGTFTGGERDAWTQRTAIHEALLVGVDLVQDGAAFPWSRHQSHAHRSAFASSEEEAEHAMAVLETLLAKAPHAPLEAKDFLGFTPLHIAAARGNLRAVTRLLAFGADVSVKDVLDRTAWRVALLRGHDACFQEIRRKWLQDVVSNNAEQRSGAQDASSAANAAGTRAVVTPAGAVTMALHPQLERELFAACKAGDVAKMRFFVDECDVSVNAVEDAENAGDSSRLVGRSLLMVACECRHVRAVKFLLMRSDLSVNFTTMDGRSALAVAQRSVESASTRS
jgi:ankyrin repeat protein